MDMKGEYRIPASRDEVWRALNDPQVLKQAIPGCETIEKHSDTELEASVMARIGPVHARFRGRITLSDLDPPNSYVISGEGAGGAAGFANGSASVTLAEEAGETVLAYTVHAQVGGKLAQIGSRLIDIAAKKMADDFFESFVVLAGGTEATPGVEETVAEKHSSLPVWVWASAVILLIAAGLWYYA